jgi:hypothetical protein
MYKHVSSDSRLQVWLTLNTERVHHATGYQKFLDGS